MVLSEGSYPMEPNCIRISDIEMSIIEKFYLVKLHESIRVRSFGLEMNVND